MDSNDEKIPPDALVCWDCGTPLTIRPDGALKPCGHVGTLVVSRAEWERLHQTADDREP